MSLLLWIVAAVLIVVGLIQLLAHALIFGIVLIVVGLVVGAFASGGVGARGPP